MPAQIRGRNGATFPVTSDLLLAILAFFIPPFTVFVKMGFSLELLINIVLTMLGAFPGIIHAWYIVLKYPDDGVPVVQDWVRRQNLISPATSSASGGYEQIGDDPSALESGVMPGAYQQNQTAPPPPVPSQQYAPYPQAPQQPFPQEPQYQQPYQPQQPLQQQQQQQQQQSQPSYGSSAEGSSSSGNPPSYQQQGGAPPNFVPGDNKIQYGAQF